MTQSVAGLMEKARRSLASAEILLNEKDCDGACNRAYYAMFDAARAMLLRAGKPLPKTHSGLVAAFGLEIVGKGQIGREHGAALNRVQRMREVADYTGEELSFDEVQVALAAAKSFLTAVEMAGD